MGAKWLELLKEIAPGVTRVAVLRDPALTAGTAQFAAIQALGARWSCAASSGSGLTAIVLSACRVAILCVSSDLDAAPIIKARPWHLVRRSSSLA